MKIHQVGDIVALDSDGYSYIFPGREVNPWDSIDRVIINKGDVKMILFMGEEQYETWTDFQNLIITKDTHFNLAKESVFHLTNKDGRCCIWAYHGQEIVAELPIDKVYTKAGVTLSDGHDIMELLFGEQ